MAGNVEDNAHIGGFDVEFVTDPPIDVSCAICLLTMKNPVQTDPCFHQFCEDCITRHRNSSAGLHLCCPLCNDTIKSWFVDGATKRMIFGLLIRCPNYNEGCLITFELRSLDKHLLTCGYQEIQCTITNCEIKVQRRYLENHLAECTNRTVRCEHCNNSYIFKHKQIHEVDCKRFPEQCTDNCGEIVAREEMAMHLEDVCPKTIHLCKYLNIICCKEQGTRKELAEHMENHIKRHLSLAIDKIEDIGDFTSCEIKKLKDDKEKMSSEIKEVKDDKLKMSREIKQLNDGKERMSREIKEVKDSKLKMLREIKDLNDGKLKMSREIKELNDGKEKMSREIQELKDLMTRTFKFPFHTLNRASIEINNFAANKEQVEETGLRKNFYRVFFCFDGYQAKLNVQIEQDTRSGVNIVASFVLIKGPYDDHLEWPFVGKVQVSCKGGIHTEPRIFTFSSLLKPHEVIENCFMKPISENIGFGWSVLSNDKFKDYVMNDTLKIEIEVSKIEI